MLQEALTSCFTLSPSDVLEISDYSITQEFSEQSSLSNTLDLSNTTENEKTDESVITACVEKIVERIQRHDAKATAVSLILNILGGEAYRFNRLSTILINGESGRTIDLINLLLLDLSEMQSEMQIPLGIDGLSAKCIELIVDMLTGKLPLGVEGTERMQEVIDEIGA
jgi:hypothetical protein